MDTVLISLPNANENNEKDYPAIYQYILLGGLLLPFIIIRVVNYILYSIKISGTSSRSSSDAKLSTSSNAGEIDKVDNDDKEGNEYAGTQRHLSIRLYDSFYALVAAPLNSPLGQLSNRSRFKLLLFGGFIFANIIFCTTANPSSSPYLRRISQNTGLMAYANLPLLFLLATRNNMLTYVTGKPYQHFRSFHILLGSLVIVLVVIHSICYSVLEIQMGIYIASWDANFRNYGVLATCAMTILILAPSILFFRKCCYELFFIAHATGAAIVLVGCYYHRPQIELRKWIITCICIWGLDRFFRYARLIFYHSRFSLSFTPIKLSRATLNARYISDAIVIDVQREENSTSYSVFPSSHIYLSFLDTKLLLNHPTLLAQNHPFSIISSMSTPVPLLENNENHHNLRHVSLSSSAQSFPDSSNLSLYSPASVKKPIELKKSVNSSMRLIIRSRDGMTRLLQEEIRRQDNQHKDQTTALGEEKLVKKRENSVAFLHALIEGPYGGIDSNWKSYDTVALFAAGAGISHIFGIFTYLCHHVYAANARQNDRKKRNKIITKNIHLNWVFRHIEELYWISDYLLDILSFSSASSSLSIKVNLYITQLPPHPSNYEYIKNLSDNDNIKRLYYFDALHSLTSSTLISFVYGHRPDIAKEIHEIVHISGDRVQVHVCGPSSFDKSVRVAASKASNLKEAFAGRGVVHVNSEPFE